MLIERIASVDVGSMSVPVRTRWLLEFGVSTVGHTSFDAEAEVELGLAARRNPVVAGHLDMNATTVRGVSYWLNT